MGLRMLPECDWRRRRAGIVVRSPDMVLVVVVRYIQDNQGQHRRLVRKTSKESEKEGKTEAIYEV